MRQTSPELHARLLHAAGEIERFFRVRLAEADEAPAIEMARNGLRNAIGARLAMESWPVTERVEGVGRAHN